MGRWGVLFTKICATVRCGLDVIGIRCMLNWGYINDSTTVVEGSVLVVQWLV